jgi:hypothetical protein
MYVAVTLIVLGVLVYFSSRSVFVAGGFRALLGWAGQEAYPTNT